MESVCLCARGFWHLRTHTIYCVMCLGQELAHSVLQGSELQHIVSVKSNEKLHSHLSLFLRDEWQAFAFRILGSAVVTSVYLISRGSSLWSAGSATPSLNGLSDGTDTCWVGLDNNSIAISNREIIFFNNGDMILNHISDIFNIHYQCLFICGVWLRWITWALHVSKIKTRRVWFIWVYFWGNRLSSE